MTDDQPRAPAGQATRVISLVGADDPAGSAKRATPTKATVTGKIGWLKRLSATKKAQRKRLTDLELRERLLLDSCGLVEEIYAIALRQNAGEDQRESRLNAKAQGLLGTAGLSLTVAFTFGGILLQHPEYLEPLGLWPARGVLALYALALLCGLFASVQAVLALYIKNGFRSPSESAVFNAEQLKSIEREAANDDDKAKAIYRRYMTIQYWTNWQQTFALHERRATSIKRGQISFMLFLFSLILIGCAMTCSAFERLEGSPSSPSQTTTP